MDVQKVGINRALHAVPQVVTGQVRLGVWIPGDGDGLGKAKGAE